MKYWALSISILQETKKKVRDSERRLDQSNKDTETLVRDRLVEIERFYRTLRPPVL